MKKMYVVFKEEQDDIIILGIFKNFDNALKYSKKNNAYVEETNILD